MSKIIYTKGLPASGKSTWAKEWVEKHPNVKRVNKDDLRAMMDKSWSKNNEDFTLAVRDLIIEQALSKGYDIIVDDTNLHPKHEVTFKELASKYKADLELKDFTDVSLMTCLERNATRQNSVPEKAIRQMYNQYLKPDPLNTKPYPHDPNLRDAIICDIDGTIAHMTTRRGRPYDWHRVGEDAPDETIIDIVNMYATVRDVRDDYPVIIMLSGRDGVCRPETEEWLKANNVRYDELFMREQEDNRKDFLIKEELFDNHIRGKYNVKFVLDDRDQVVKKWRELGLKCLQVAPGDF